MHKTFIAFVLMLGVLVGGMPAQAQSVDVVEVAVEENGAVQVLSAENETELVAEVETEKTEKTEQVKPGSWGLFWISVREQWSLLTTRSPEEKAELRVKFAEARLAFAEKFAANANDEKTQKRAEHMVERATVHLNKVSEKRGEWLSHKEERAQRTLERAALQTERREKMLEDLEKERPERAPKLEDLRERGDAGKEQLLKALENDNLPEDVRARLEVIKARIEMYDTRIEETKEERGKLIERIKSGDKDAAKELRALHQKRGGDSR